MDVLTLCFSEKLPAAGNLTFIFRGQWHMKWARFCPTDSDDKSNNSVPLDMPTLCTHYFQWWPKHSLYFCWSLLFLSQMFHNSSYYQCWHSMNAMVQANWFLMCWFESRSIPSMLLFESKDVGIFGGITVYTSFSKCSMSQS